LALASLAALATLRRSLALVVSDISSASAGVESAPVWPSESWGELIVLAIVLVLALVVLALVVVLAVVLVLALVVLAVVVVGGSSVSSTSSSSSASSAARASRWATLTPLLGGLVLSGLGQLDVDLAGINRFLVEKSNRLLGLFFSFHLDEAISKRAGPTSDDVG
jgi:hypothetical protein